MTPLSSIDGVLFSKGLIPAVDLKPEGRILVAPATLTIQPPQGISPKDVVGFSYNHEGEEPFLYPMETTSTSVTFSVMHFSDLGGGTGTISPSMDGAPPSSSEDQANQTLLIPA